MAEETCRDVDMKGQSIVHVALVVRDYDEAIEFYTNKLRFSLVEDTYQPEQNKRWVVVAPLVQLERHCYWRRQRPPNRKLLLGISQAAGCSCFSTPMIFGEITMRWLPRESSLFESRKTRPTE